MPLGLFFMISTTSFFFAHPVLNLNKDNDAGAVFLFTLWAFVMVRACLVGVWIGEETTIVRSWFYTWKLLTKTIVSCSAEPYWGILNRGDADWSGRRIKMLVFTLPAGRTVTARGTLSGKKSSQRQVAQIMATLVSVR